MNIEHRWQQHIYNSKNGSQHPIHRALRKYGVDDNTSIDFLMARKSILENPQQKMVYQYSLNGELLGEYCSTGEASRQTGISQQNISSVCRGQRVKTGGYIWSYEKN